MKKIIALSLMLMLLLTALVSCGKDDTKLNVGFMNGPTGIGMAKLISDNGKLSGNERYSFEKFEDTTLAAEAIKAGRLDVACLPTNEAAKIYNTTNSEIQVLAINCLNSLYIVAKNGIEIDEIEDLNGKTVYTCKNGTPKIIFDKLIDAFEIEVTVKTELGEGDNATVINKPQDLPAVISAEKADIVLAPEPIVTNALMKNSNYSVKLDIGDAWNEKFDTPIAMGCIIARKDFVLNHKSVIDNFLEEYKQSIEFMSNAENLELAAQYAVDTTIMGALPAAKKAIQNLGTSIAYIDGSDMKDTLINIYNAFGMKVIGEKLPDDEFYYGS